MFGGKKQDGESVKGPVKHTIPAGSNASEYKKYASLTKI